MKFLQVVLALALCVASTYANATINATEVDTAVVDAMMRAEYASDVCKLDCKESYRSLASQCESIASLDELAKKFSCLGDAVLEAEHCVVKCDELEEEQVDNVVMKNERSFTATASCPLCDMGCDAGGQYLKAQCEAKFPNKGLKRSACKGAVNIAVKQCSTELCSSGAATTLCDAIFKLLG